MASEKSIWTILMLFFTMLSTTLIIFRFSKFVVPLTIISGLILISVIAYGGLFSGRSWGVGLLTLVFTAMILYHAYLYRLGVKGYLFEIAFISAVIGLLIVLTFKSRKKKPVVRTYQIKPSASRKIRKTVKRKAAKKKVTKKKVAKKKKRVKKKKRAKAAKKRVKKRARK